MSILKTTLTLVGVALAASLTGCTSTEDSGSDSGKPDYYDTCVELNEEPGAYYVDPDVCAADAQQLADDMADYMESHP
jgi:type IV pilus biogenesis protein CpaD/CtpE